MATPRRLKGNRIEVAGDVAVLYTSPRTGEPIAITIDAADVDLVRPYTWRARRHRYGAFSIESQPRGDNHASLVLPRLVTGAKAGEFVTHRNGDSLDCRRRNLVIARTGDQIPISVRKGRVSHYRGVNQTKNGRRWNAHLLISAGSFATEEEAARAYDQLVRRHLGSAGYLNFPDTEEAPNA